MTEIYAWKEFSCLKRRIDEVSQLHLSLFVS